MARKYISIKRLDIDYVFGLDEPMYTGMLNGLLYGIIYNILGFVHEKSRIEECSTNIVPDFDRVCHNISVCCILRLKNVHIIGIVVRLAKMYIKFKNILKKEGK